MIYFSLKCQVKCVSLYISDSDIDQAQAKDLIEGFKIDRHELDPDNSQAKTYGEVILSKDAYNETQEEKIKTSKIKPG